MTAWPWSNYWADGPRTFLGVQTHGFPNLFFPGGPHAAAGNNPRYNGDQVDFITDLLVYARDHGCDVVEVTERAEDRWTRMIDRGAASPLSFGENSYYFGTNIPGKPKRYLLNSGGRPKFFSDRRRRRSPTTTTPSPCRASSETGRRAALSRAEPPDVTPWRPA